MRVLIRLAVALAVAAIGFYLARRTAIGLFRELDVLYPFVAWLGVGVAIIGFVWIMRIAREDPDGSDRSWRYRDF